jgi:hypothetical protein
MRGLLFLGIIITMMSGCDKLQNTISQPKTIIDWVNFVKLNGITYSADLTYAGRELEKSDLGSAYANVKFKVADNISDSNYMIKDGDAAFLEAGTPVYTVNGYKPEFRLAAYLNGRIVLFEADQNPHAKKGADLLDLKGKVSYIGINSEYDGKTELAAIKDPEQVERLVELVSDAPINKTASREGGTERYFIAFHMQDGTAVVRSYWTGAGELFRGIHLSDEFNEAIKRALYNQQSKSDSVVTSPQETESHSREPFSYEISSADDPMAVHAHQMSLNEVRIPVIVLPGSKYNLQITFSEAVDRQSVDSKLLQSLSGLNWNTVWHDDQRLELAIQIPKDFTFSEGIDFYHKSIDLKGIRTKHGNEPEIHTSFPLDIAKPATYARLNVKTSEQEELFTAIPYRKLKLSPDGKIALAGNYAENHHASVLFYSLIDEKGRVNEFSPRQAAGYLKVKIFKPFYSLHSR